MQYYLNGFRAGDPRIQRPAAGHGCAGAGELPEEVDVLIVGCGPAGLTLAAQLSAFPEITTRIVEQKPGPIEIGQADGINVRSMEMFQAFGFADKVKEEAYWVNETVFWVPDPENPANIVRTGRVQDVPEDQSEMPHTLMNQARVHQLYLDYMRASPSRLEPNYALQIRDLTIDTTTEDHPVTVVLERTSPMREGQTVTVKANYVVGCDGARSNVRKAIGGELKGDAAHQAWGVMDILAVTDFPDIRMKCLIQSANGGNVLILPREGGYLFRMYVELDKLDPTERVADRGLTTDDMIAAANRIMAPYTIDVKEVAWASIYEIGHRMTNKFDDVPEGETATRTPRVFTAGDACHTHSPKAGQGMNVSMGDTFNLGWKLIQVFKGRSKPDLLHSYSTERWAAAKGLVETDHKWARIMSAPPGESELDDDSGLPRFARQFMENLEFTGGLSICYPPSVLTGEATYQHLAAGQPIGRRFHSAPVVRLADAKPMQLGHVIEADARWRIFAFAGADDNGQPGGALAELCEFLRTAPQSPLWRHTAPDEDIDAVIDVRAVLQAGFRELDFDAMPALLRPHKGRYRLCDYEKVFCADVKRGDIFDLRAIDRDHGCAVIVRPDQYIAHVLPLGAHEELAAFFAGFLLER
ncbi:MAG: phenol 2-monooxygenase [Hyphomicrobiales bacterium]|nr:MAG: phenol 2-monooxygenase [Hyphomicrobiales bacterium]